MKTLRERNTEIQNKALVNSEEAKALREGMKARFGVDPLNSDDKFSQALREGKLSWNSIKSQCLREADSESSFVQFLRAGVQNLSSALYEATPTTYEDWVHVRPSKLKQELYPLNQGVSFPRQVGPSEIYPEVAAAAMDQSLVNLKFGAIYAVEKELLDDDQTGTFAQQAGLLGEYMKILAEVLCYGKLASVSGMQYADYKIPVSETQPSNEAVWPWAPATTPFIGGGYNRPATYTIVTQAAIQAGIVTLQNQKNLQSLKMMVNPKRLIVGTAQSFDSAVLAHSAYYPSVPGSAGATGGNFAINPIKGLFDITVSRFVFKNDGTVDGTSKAWFLVDDSKPWFILQMHTPLSVVQEAPNSGSGFTQDIYRFKGSCRMNADFIDPRFAFQGNDGSITS